jgi:hypothetical protein
VVLVAQLEHSTVLGQLVKPLMLLVVALEGEVVARSELKRVVVRQSVVVG